MLAKPLLLKLYVSVFCFLQQNPVYRYLHKYTVTLEVVATQSSSIYKYLAMNVTRVDCDTDQKTKEVVSSGFVQYLQGQGVVPVVTLKIFPVQFDEIILYVQYNLSYANFSYWLVLESINPDLEAYEVKELSLSKDVYRIGCSFPFALMGLCVENFSLALKIHTSISAHNIFTLTLLFAFISFAS